MAYRNSIFTRVAADDRLDALPDSGKDCHKYECDISRILYAASPVVPLNFRVSMLKTRITMPEDNSATEKKLQADRYLQQFLDVILVFTR